MGVGQAFSTSWPGLVPAIYANKVPRWMAGTKPGHDDQEPVRHPPRRRDLALPNSGNQTAHHFPVRPNLL
jgi:hypothetical protein